MTFSSRIVENCILKILLRIVLKIILRIVYWNIWHNRNGETNIFPPFLKKLTHIQYFYLLFIVIGFPLSGEANKIYFPFQSPLNLHIKEKKRGSNYEWSLVALFSLLLVLHTHIPFSIFHFQCTRIFLVNMILYWVAYTMENMQLF